MTLHKPRDANWKTNRGIELDSHLNALNVATVAAVLGRDTFGSHHKRSSHWQLPSECRIDWRSLSSNSRVKSACKRVWSSIPMEIAFFSTHRLEAALFTKLDQCNAEPGHFGKAMLSHQKLGHKLPRVAQVAIRADFTT